MGNKADENGYSGLIKSARPKLVLFIHGIGGSADHTTWAQFPQLIADDPKLNQTYDVALFDYRTGFLQLGEVPSVSDVAEHLHNEITLKWPAYGEIIIIAHSQGGLVARRYIADRLGANEPCPVKRVLYFATPHSGGLMATIISKAKEIVEPFLGNSGVSLPDVSKQFKDLAIGSEALQNLAKEEKNTQAVLKTRTRHIVAGDDALVVKPSAWGPEGPGDYFVVPGHDHRSIVKPENIAHPAFKHAQLFLAESQPGPADHADVHFEPPYLEIKVRDSTQTEETCERERFIYRARALPFIGRDDEEEIIGTFLAGFERRFSWMLLSGSGGVGKSRLALEVVLAQQSGWWHSGFLHDGDLETRDWKRWQPRQPTFMVIDYAARAATHVGKLLKNLADRDASQTLHHPVRVLLIERDKDGNWMDELNAAFSDIDMEASRDGSLELVTIKNIWPIFEHVWAGIPTAERAEFPDKVETLKRLEDIDKQSRPLYAFLMADAMKREGHVRHWDAAALLGNVIEHERKIWRDVAANLGLGRNIEREEWALALATMCGGVPIEVLQEEALKGFMPKWDVLNHPKLFATMTGREIGEELDSEIIPALEPDIIGEFFCLELFGGTSKAAKHVRNFAWNNFTEPTAQFIHRSIDDFPEHGALAAIMDLPLENALQRHFWSLLAVLLLIQLEERDIEKAIAVYDELANLAITHGGEPKIRQVLADAAFILINHLAKSDIEKAEKLYSELVAWAKAHNNEPEIRLEQAKAAASMAVTFINNGNYQAAKSYFEIAKELEAEFDKEDLALGVNLLQALFDHPDVADETKGASSAADAETIADDEITTPVANEVAPPASAKPELGPPPQKHSLAVTALKALTLLTLALMVAGLALVGLIIANEEAARAFVAWAGNAAPLSGLVDLVMSGLKNLP